MDPPVWHQALVNSLPAAIAEATKSLYSHCEDIAGKNSQLVQYVKNIVAEIIAMHGLQIRLKCAILQIQEVEHSGTDNVADSILPTIENQKQIQMSTVHAIKFSSKLCEKAKDIQSKLEYIQGIAEDPHLTVLLEYAQEQHGAYLEDLKKLTAMKEGMNSSSHFRTPGDEYGLIPFKDIMYDGNAHVLLWDHYQQLWEYPEELHPCRKIPGSTWGKIHYDLTFGKFFSDKRRSTVEWTHAGTSKYLVDGMERISAILQRQIAQSTETTGQSGKIKRRNERLCKNLGLPFPIPKNHRFHRIGYEWNVYNLIASPFDHWKSTAPNIHLQKLAIAVDEITYGPKPRQAVHDHERFILRTRRQ